MPARVPAFSARLLKRWELWWGRPFRWAQMRSYRDLPHRVYERFAMRSRTDPDAAWQCCPYWPRTLLNKWNSREFAQAHGCRVPALYWHGRWIAKIPFASLPSRYVVRPVWGAGRQGVHVVSEGRELLRDRPAAVEAIRRSLFGEHGPMAVTPLLVEEFVPAENGAARMPTEYKCHTFGSAVAAVQVIERTGRHSGAHRFYTPDWEPFPDVMSTSYPPAALRSPPRCLEEMLDAATRLGQIIGTYMRVDFFAGDAGTVFNEFASTPQLHKPFTPYCEEAFGALWQQRFPDAI